MNRQSWMVEISANLSGANLPTEMDCLKLIYCHILKLKTENADFLNKNPSFKDFKVEVMQEICKVWDKACVPRISLSRIETKLKTLFDDFRKEKMKADKLKKELSSFFKKYDKLFDLCACKCVIPMHPKIQNGRVVCDCKDVSRRLPSEGLFGVIKSNH